MKHRHQLNIGGIKSTACRKQRTSICYADHAGSILFSHRNPRTFSSMVFTRIKWLWKSRRTIYKIKWVEIYLKHFVNEIRVLKMKTKIHHSNHDIWITPPFNKFQASLAFISAFSDMSSRPLVSNCHCFWKKLSVGLASIVSVVTNRFTKLGSAISTHFSFSNLLAT